MTWTLQELPVKISHAGIWKRFGKIGQAQGSVPA